MSNSQKTRNGNLERATGSSASRTRWQRILLGMTVLFLATAHLPSFAEAKQATFIASGYADVK